MAEPTRIKSKGKSHPSPDIADNDNYELCKSVICSRPSSNFNGEAEQTIGIQLERLATDHGMDVDTLIEQAHTTRDSKAFHLEAMQLERQLAFLRR